MWDCEGSGVDEREVGAEDIDIPHSSAPLVGVFFTVCVDQSDFFFGNLLDSNLVKFHFNFGFRQVKSG